MISLVCLFILTNGLTNYGFFGFFLNRFRQKKHPKCYSEGHKLSLSLCNHLKKLFPRVFDHLEMVRSKENLPEHVARVGESPFTGMIIKRDYTCNPYTHEDDLNYGFFMWLGANGKFLSNFLFFTNSNALLEHYLSFFFSYAVIVCLNCRSKRCIW